MTLLLIIIGANVATWCWLAAKASQRDIAEATSEPLAPPQQVRPY